MHINSVRKCPKLVYYIHVSSTVHIFKIFPSEQFPWAVTLLSTCVMLLGAFLINFCLYLSVRSSPLQWLSRRSRIVVFSEHVLVLKRDEVGGDKSWNYGGCSEAIMLSLAANVRCASALSFRKDELFRTPFLRHFHLLRG
jgi:hypothetical protein